MRGAGALSSYRTKLRIAGAVALVGALVGLIAYAKVYGDLNALGSGTRINVPGSGTVELGTGTFALFQKTGDTNTAGPVRPPETVDPSVDPAELEIVAPGGEPVAVELGGGDIVKSGGESFTTIAEFDAATAGTYEVVANTSSRGQLIVGRERGDLLRSLWPWITVSIAGAVVALAGVVAVIVLLVRRRAMA